MHLDELDAHLQRRDLQFSRAARQAGRPVSLGDGQRGHPAPLSRARARLRARAARDVRLRDLGRAPEAPFRGARPAGHQAVLLPPARRRPGVRLGSRAATGARPARDRPRRDRRLPHLQLRADAEDALEGHLQAGPRSDSDLGRGHDAHRELLEAGAALCHRRPRRRDRGARRAARPHRPRALALRRAGRRLLERRHRLGGRDFVPEEAEDLHSRPTRGHPRRGPRGAGGGRPPRHPAHRGDGRGAGPRRRQSTRW